LSFSYNYGIIDNNAIINISADNEPILELLNRVFNDPNLNFTLIGRHIVIFKSIVTSSADPEKQDEFVQYVEVRGMVTDPSGRQPLPFANVYLAGKSKGIITNEEGRFLLKLQPEDISDTLNISYMGYKNLKIPVSGIANSDQSFTLEPDIISIQEVIIRKVNAINILQSALKAIPNNYPSQPSILTSFYRETVKKGNRYMIVSEALLETFKLGYSTFPMQADQVKIIRGRNSEDVNQGDTVMLRLKAGLNTMLLLDVIRHPPDFLSSDEFYKYSYNMADIVTDNGRDHYAIDFSPVEYNYDNFYTGRILIDVESLSINKVNFSIHPDKLRDATSLFVLKKPLSMNVRVLNAVYTVAFRKASGYNYLHMIHCETQFRIRYKNQLLGSVYSTALEMVVTEMDTSSVERFRLRETARTQDIFIDQISGYDEDFWGEYNYISPDEPLEQGLLRLSNQ